MTAVGLPVGLAPLPMVAAASERTPRKEADRTCCCADFVAAGRASLRRNRLGADAMMHDVSVW